MRVICVLAVCLSLLAALLGPVAGEENSYPQAPPQDMQWWRDARFGMFVHWGPVTQTGKEISWSRCEKPHFENRRLANCTPAQVYDSLYKTFNPTQFNAEQWVQAAKAAGMKYIIFTSKHHDGFCMFDSKLTDYKITNSPIGRDLLKELADACHRNNMRFGVYYSVPDWVNAEYAKPDYGEYVSYLSGQVRELLTNYGKISVLWFDVGKGFDPKKAVPVHKMARELQPGLIINNRFGIPGDYDTPEQRVGAFQNTRAWESCMTIGTQWAWKPNDTVKPLKQCLQALIGCACGDGNLLFNVGPDATGRIEPEQIARLKEMGQWLEKYGNTIYGTRGGPYVLRQTGGSTYKGNSIYLHIYDWPADGLALPSIPKKIVSAKCLTGGDVTWKQTAIGVTLSLPEAARDPIDTIVELRLDAPAADIAPIRIPSYSASFGKPATASSVSGSGAFSADKAFDDDPESRWAAAAGDTTPWLAVDLGKLTRINRAMIRQLLGRVGSYELQYKSGDQWVTFYKGEKLGAQFDQTFEPVTARYFRLNVLQATDAPSIFDFQLLPPKSAKPAETRKP